MKQMNFPCAAPSFGVDDGQIFQQGMMLGKLWVMV